MTRRSRHRATKQSLLVNELKEVVKKPVKQPSKASDQSIISGVLRVRPAKSWETPYMVCHPKKGFTLSVSEDYTYGEDTWAGVLGPECPQHDVFLAIGLPIVEAVMAGRRACLFAYGQTGSGKTFSMYGADGGKNPAKLDGAVPAICAELFRRKTDAEKRKHDIKLAMFASLVEVRGGEILDLLADPVGMDLQQPRVKLVRNELLGVHREAISSQRVLTGLIELGMSRRMTAVKAQNASSSRSHAFLTVDVEKETKHADGRTVKEVTHMHLVDLAGSEKYSSSDAEGLAINQSLLCLGNVIMAKARDDHHVPYRDSIITRMLRESLESECTTIILGCLNPGTDTMSETKNVLKFMERAAAVDKKDGKSKSTVSILHQKRVLAAAAEIAGGKDPLRGDKEDEIKFMLRRTETIMTKTFGGISARVCGDPMAPLVLYFHNGHKVANENSNANRKVKTSKMWNGMVTELANRIHSMTEEDTKNKDAEAQQRKEAKKLKKEAAANMPQVPVEEITDLEPGASTSQPTPNATGKTGTEASHRSSEGNPPKSSEATVRTKRAKPLPRSSKAAPINKSLKGSKSVKSLANNAADGSKPEKKTKATIAAENDDRLAELRSSLFLLLRTRQQELCKDLACHLCRMPLVSPTRLPRCRHVLCEACTFTSMRYFAECPCCQKRIDRETDGSGLPIDTSHSQLMKMRFENAQVATVLVQKQRRRALLLSRESERTERFIIEFGVYASGDEDSDDENSSQGFSSAPTTDGEKKGQEKGQQEKGQKGQEKGHKGQEKGQDKGQKGQEKTQEKLAEKEKPKPPPRKKGYTRTAPPVETAPAPSSEPEPEQQKKRIPDHGKAFVTIVRSPPGLVDEGESIFSKVSICGPDTEGPMRVDEELGSSITVRLDEKKPAVRLHMSIVFNPALGLAPLQIKYRGPVRKYSRRLVVQMPQAKRSAPVSPRARHFAQQFAQEDAMLTGGPASDMTDRSKKTNGENNDGSVDTSTSRGTSRPAGSSSLFYVVFDCLDAHKFSTNGWVVYLPDWFCAPSEQPRASAVVHASKTRDMLAKEEGGGSASESWLTQMAQQTDLLVSKFLGPVSDVVQILIHGAYKRWSIKELADRYVEAKKLENPGKKAVASLIVQDLSAGRAFGKVETIYGELSDFIHEDAGRIQRLLQDGRLHLETGVHGALDDAKRPHSLYQVAVDLAPTVELTGAMLDEIIRTVGKNHAYAIIASSISVVPILNCLISHQKLANFLIFKDPCAPSIPPKTQSMMSMIVQPTLVLVEGGKRARTDLRTTARTLETVLTRCHCPDMTHSVGDPSKAMISKIIEFFRETSWVGSFSTDGTDPEKPVITRLTGGINAWMGTVKPEKKKTAKEKAKKCWMRVRIAFRLKAFKLDTFGTILS